MQKASRFLLIILAFWCSTFCVEAQIKISRSTDIEVIEEGNPLINPWTGGLFNPQFYELDCDFDNDKELFVFDHQGDQILVFENFADSLGFTYYKFNNSFVKLFPKATNWVHLRDFNCDDLPDFLSYNPSNNNILQYSGFQNADGLLEFELQDSVIYSDLSQSELLPFNFYDRPAFEDIDNDGDLDILFFNASDQVNFYANRSIELNGDCNSFLLELVEDCWGKFDEDLSTNYFSLDIECDSIGLQATAQNRHTGSSRMLFLDAGQDEVWDLVAGYGSEEQLAFLQNGGSVETAFMTNIDSLFPANDIIIQLPGFPAAYFFDYENDGIEELLISPSFEGKAENNIWLYKNKSTDNFPLWERVQTNFLQDQMIDAGAYCHPELIDVNADGLEDLILSNRGLISEGNNNAFISYLTFYENTGTSTDPKFQLVEKDWMGLSNLNLSHIKPSFGDLDGDGDKDLIIGDYFGELFFIENIAGPTASIALNLTTTSNLGLDVGYFATPQLIDIDEDGDLDLLSGEAQGRVFYYSNEGDSSNFNFNLINDFYGSIDVRAEGSLFGYSVPFLFRPNDETSSILLVGNIDGNVFAFNGVDQQLNVFESIIPEFSTVNTGANASPHILFSQEKDHYLITGTIRGGLQLHSIKEDLFLHSDEQEYTFPRAETALKLFPNPIRSNIISLEFPTSDRYQQGDILVYNFLGQLVLKQTFDLIPGKQLYTLNISKFSHKNGIYKIRWSGTRMPHQYQASFIKVP